MANVGCMAARNKRTQVTLRQPARHHLAQHAGPGLGMKLEMPPLALARGRGTLSCHDEHAPELALRSSPEKCRESHVRLCLRHPMQVERGFRFNLTLAQTFNRGTVESDNGGKKGCHRGRRRRRLDDLFRHVRRLGRFRNRLFLLYRMTVLLAAMLFNVPHHLEPEGDLVFSRWSVTAHDEVS